VTEPVIANETDVLARVRRDSARVLAFTAMALASALVVLLLVVSTVGWHFYGQLRTAQQGLGSAQVKIKMAQGQIQAQQVANRKGRIATCEFYLGIGTAPVIGSGPTATGRVGVRIIEEARNSYAQRGCGTLPKPSSELSALEHTYHIPNI
jgi:hypothetical protein